ncbi:GNAT family N-acetyltransferase [Cytobacillus purgationiresistens]|uniref:RimJ/RimL family protein N-acetyltransferase n=1 Tax=Cytobacillus purgationiresistens TaxID=863449 RepID=A0ABU0AIT4_9BACI|nr:GNAT family N-acetyltransferase [Cytobacillus purgationiresistens]MDQ0270621.1 RimJ/RimL family protein N-acetyltransferase [Cytobacillus purgationiresistens]
MSVSENNSVCTIRIGEIEDAEKILEVKNAVISEGKYLISVSEEVNNTLEQQREWLESLLENEKGTLLVAEVNGHLVGWIVFHSQDRKRMSHIGSITMMISQNYRGMGIGKNLVKALINWAEKHPTIEKVSLGVFSTNHRAIALYKSMGFIEEGRKIREFKINENEYIDDILMYKLVK